MRWTSTRRATRATLKEAVLRGLPDKGDGLYMPAEAVPRLTEAELARWEALPVPELAVEVASRFVGEADVPRARLRELVLGSMRRLPPLQLEALPEASPRAPELGLVARLGDGPSYAFKDWGMLPAMALLSHLLREDGARGRVVVCTSGDTGPSALECARGLDNLDVHVLFPAGRVSKAQALQMTTHDAPNAFVYEVTGADSDALDRVAYRVFDELREPGVVLTSLNSFNVARIVFSVTHFFAVAFAARRRGLARCNVVIPSGALGNAVAGALAVQLGLPGVVRLVLATNENDAAARFLCTGELSAPAPGRGTVATLSPAMDIGVPYNVERLVWLWSGGDFAATRAFMEAYERDGRARLDVAASPVFAIVRGGGLVAGSATDAETLALVRCAWRERGVLLDPHTAVAACVAGRLASASAGGADQAVAAAAASAAASAASAAWVCLGTAHEFKLAEELRQRGGVGGGLAAHVPEAVRARLVERGLLGAERSPRARLVALEGALGAVQRDFALTSGRGLRRGDSSLL